MRIEINPKNILNVENVFKVLYKLHPLALDFLLFIALDEIEDIDKLPLERREIFKVIQKGNIFTKRKIPIIPIKPKYNKDEEELEYDAYQEKTQDMIDSFNYLLKFLQINTSEYIPIKFYIEVEDIEIGKKLQALIRVMEISKDPENYYDEKREVDYYACFSKGYNYSLTSNRNRKMYNFFNKCNLQSLYNILRLYNLKDIK